MNDLETFLATVEKQVAQLRADGERKTNKPRCEKTALTEREESTGAGLCHGSYKLELALLDLRRDIKAGLVSGVRQAVEYVEKIVDPLRKKACAEDAASTNSNYELMIARHAGKASGLTEAANKIGQMVEEQKQHFNAFTA